jgi:hypothetical protein
VNIVAKSTPGDNPPDGNSSNGRLKYDAGLDLQAPPTVEIPKPKGQFVAIAKGLIAVAREQQLEADPGKFVFSCFGDVPAKVNQIRFVPNVGTEAQILAGFNRAIGELRAFKGGNIYIQLNLVRSSLPDGQRGAVADILVNLGTVPRLRRQARLQHARHALAGPAVCRGRDLAGQYSSLVSFRPPLSGCGGNTGHQGARRGRRHLHRLQIRRPSLSRPRLLELSDQNEIEGRARPQTCPVKTLIRIRRYGLARRAKDGDRDEISARLRPPTGEIRDDRRRRQYCLFEAYPRRIVLCSR